jgi:hypothetical protein
MSNERADTDNANGDWLTVAQASAALGVSARSIQKRCAAGKIVARRIVTPQGAKWEIDANQLARTDEQTREPEPRTDELKVGEPANTAREPVGAHVQNDANQRTESTEPANQLDANQRTGGADYAARLIEAQAKEIEFLKGTIEAERRDNALTVAALREAIKAMPKGLPAPGEDSASVAAQEAQNGTQNSPTAPTSPAPVIEAQRPATARRNWFARTFLKGK